MPSYMLLLYGEPQVDPALSPEEMQSVIQKYYDWREKLQDEGKLIGSDKLKDGEGRVLRGHNGRMRVLDGPYSETKEVIGGYFAIRASDYDQAVEIAGECPHLAYGGTIEIREIDQLH